MQKNNLLMVIAGVLMLVIAGSLVFIAAGMYRMDRNMMHGAKFWHEKGERMEKRDYGQLNGFVLNDEQKKEIAPLMTQLIDVHKQIAQKLVQAGAITQDMADKRIELMKERMERNLAEGRIGSMGMRSFNKNDCDGRDFKKGDGVRKNQAVEGNVKQ